MLIAAALNIPQLIFPFISSPERGTSKLFIWSFSISAVILVPMLAILIILNEHRQNSLREGYFVYQAGYIVSAVGFYLKRRRAFGGTGVRASGDAINNEEI